MTTQSNPPSGTSGQDLLFYFSALRQNATLMDCLIAMQTDAGIDVFTAEANAEECLLAVSVWDSIHAQLCDDSMAVMDRLLESLSRLEYGRRMTALQKILFGLTAWEDPDTARLLDGGVSIEQLFWEQQEAGSTSGAVFSAEELEEKIRAALSGYRLSPVCMRLLTLKMRHGSGYLAAAEALGEDGRNLKCLMTMDLWLQSRDTMTLTDAAARAAASAETQAVEDALQRGYITRDVAKMLMIAIGITLVVMGVIFMLQSMPAVASALKSLSAALHPEGPISPLLKSLLEKQAWKAHAGAIAAQAKGGLMVLGGGAMVLLSDKGAERIRGLTDRFSLLTRANDHVSGGLEDLAADKIRPAGTVYASYPEDMDIREAELEEADTLIF